MQTELSGKNYTFNIWQGEALDSKLIAMDTETSVVERPLIPELALTTASDGKSHVIIPNEKLEEFLLLHAKARFVFYNIAFDFWVIDKFLPNSSNVKNVLWEAADENRLHDYMLLDMLYRLAVNDYFPAPRNLGEASKIYAGLSINKEDPYRMRYGEIIDKNLTNRLDEVEPGFLDYAIKDTIATWIGFINLYTRAKHLAYQYGISSDKLKAHGLFTEGIQVKAAIALTKITNNGIHLDTSLSREMHREIEGEIWKVVGQLDAEYPALFKRKKKKRGQNPKDFVEGEMELTENNIPKISRTTLSEIFTGVAARLNSIDGIKLVVPKTDKGKISTSMPLWGDYIQLDDFLTKWEIWSDNTKAAQFFSKLDKEEIYPRYTIFVRTGRTSQKDPNCVDSITEVLTPSGWQNIGLAFGQTTEIMQINKDTLEMAFTKPEWVKTQSRVWVNIEGKDINMRVTPDHRCITLEGGEAKDILADNVTSRLPILKTGIYNPAREKDQIPLERRKIELLADIICNFEVTDKEISRKVWRGKLYMLKTYCYAHPYANFIISRNKEEQTATVKTSLDNLSELTEICGADFKLGNWIFTLYLEESVILLEQLQSFKYHIKNPDCPWLDILYLLTNQAKPLMTDVKRSTEVLESPEDAYCVTVPSGYFVARRAGKVFFTGNCQQIKKGRMREIIVPRKGYALVAADYSFIELRTLAYIMEKLFKKSLMAQVIREGRDPHAFLGAMLVNMDYEEFCVLKKTKPEFYDKWRQNSKALGFGIPGGLGAPSLLNYAKNIYHIKDWTIETAKTLRDKVCNEIYPELGKYLQQDGMRIMCESLECNTEDAWELFEIQGERSPFILNCIKNVVKGEPIKKDGVRYQENFINKIWENLSRLNSNPSLTKELAERSASLDLMKKLFWTSTITDTGRVRGKVSFTQSMNTPFQGPAADGAKMAGYKLVKEENKYGYKVINFVHDEFVFEVPDLGGYVSRPLCDRLLETMCEEMGKITPGLPIAGEYVVGRSWNKKNPNMKFDGDKVYF